MKQLLSKKGEVYIGVIIAVGIFLILSQTIATLVFSVYDLVVFNRSRTTARFLAEEKIETAKNISYNDLGTVGGIPSGILPQTENVVANGLNYTVTTRIDNIDDPYDGVAPADSEPVDYKRIEITVSWGGEGTTQAVKSTKLSTLISPRNDTIISGGTLEITVTDSNGAPVQAADVHIIASTLTPPVDTILTTDADGNVIVPGAQTCSSCYEISATKTGYSTDRTYGTDEVTNPIKPDVTVVEDQVSLISFTIDLTGTLTLNSTGSRSAGFPSAPNTQFILRGNKIIGTDSIGTIIYKYAQVLQTNGSATLEIPDMEWDAYHIVIPTGTGSDVTGTNPMIPVILSPGGTRTITFSTDTGSDHRLLTEFIDSSNNPIASVAATIKDTVSTYEASSSSGLVDDPDYGQVFFDNLSDSVYVLYATVSGYLEYSYEVAVNDYTRQTAILIPE